jgi:hypothetical protein
MNLVRGAAVWIGAWLATAAVILAGMAAWTYAQGGRFHRVPVCGGRGDVNVYDAAIASSALALGVVLAYWALGAASLRWRWLRVIVVAVAAVPITIVAVYGSQLFTIGCM